jgi:heme o synthase
MMSAMTRWVWAYLKAAHAGPTLAVSALATALSWAVAGPWAWTLIAVLTGQLSVGWLNDLIDRDRDLLADRREKPLVLGVVTPVGLLRGITSASAVTAITSIVAFGWMGGVLHLIAVLSAQSYNLYFKATLLSWLPYALSFGLLPTAILYSVSDTNPWRLWFVGALLGVAAHLINAIKDLEADQLTGVAGFPQRVGPQVSTIAAVVSLAGVALILFSASWWAIALAVLALLLLALPIHVRFTALIGLASLNVLLLLGSLRS